MFCVYFSFYIFGVGVVHQLVLVLFTFVFLQCFLFLLMHTRLVHASHFGCMAVSSEHTSLHVFLLFLLDSEHTFVTYVSFPFCV